MEVKPGYKQTKVGVIPEEWEVKRIIDCCDYADYRGKTPPKTSRGIFLVTAKNVRKGFIDYEESQEYVPTELYDQIMRRGRPRIGDILITTEAPLGNVAQVDREDIALAQRIIKYRPRRSDLSANYLKQYFLSERFQQILNDHGSGSTAKGIKGSILHLLPIVIPPPPEQRAIAEALSDVDGLLGGLDRLISKKRDLKRAAMQQLLTGQTRLPGFHGEWVRKFSYKQTEVGIIPEDWEVAPLSREIERLEAGVSVNSVDEELRSYAHEQTILKTSAISGGQFLPHEHKKIAPRDIGRAKLNPRFDTIIISRMNTPELVGECGYVDANYNNLFLPDRLWMTRIRLGSNVCVRWLNYLLSSKPYKARIKDLATGTSGSMKNIGKDSLLALSIPYPISEEQRAIAAVLSDMDAAITALEQRREKTRALKQAMMQELLTGKTRLVALGGAHA